MSPCHGQEGAPKDTLSEPGVRKNLAESRKTPEENDFHPGGARLRCHQRGSVEDVTREGFATRTCPAMEAGPLHTTQAQTQICQGVPPQGCGIKRAREGRCRGDWTAQVLLVSGMHTSQDDAPKCWELYTEEYRVSIAPLALPRYCIERHPPSCVDEGCMIGKMSVMNL